MIDSQKMDVNALVALDIAAPGWRDLIDGIGGNVWIVSLDRIHDPACCGRQHRDRLGLRIVRQHCEDKGDIHASHDFFNVLNDIERKFRYSFRGL